MAKQTKTPPTFEGKITDLVPATPPSSLHVAAYLAGSRESLEAIRAISEQGQVDNAQQAGIAWKARVAHQYQKALFVESQQTYAEYLEDRRALLDMPGRDARDQEILKSFAATLDKAAGDTLATTCFRAVSALDAIVSKPFNPHIEKEDIVITEEPNGLAKFFGASTKTTRIPR